MAFPTKRDTLVPHLIFFLDFKARFVSRLQDKWVYIGTERGNVYCMNLETFQLSAYIISWNKLMDPMQKNHPGAISHLSTNPTDPGKVLIGKRPFLIQALFFDDFSVVFRTLLHASTMSQDHPRYSRLLADFLTVSEGVSF